MRVRVATILFALMLARPALASPEPWSDGVSRTDQDRATALFMDGNRLYAQEALAPAIEKYRAALQIWDHPLIHYNLAVALVRQEKYVDAAGELERAKKFGDAPFTDQILRTMLEYEAKIKAQVGEIEATCTGERATVVLDGKDWFACPGTQRIRVVVGDHTVIAGNGAARVTVAGGAHVSTTVREGSLARTERRWRPWIPWTITLAGGALALTGMGIALEAKSRYDDYMTSCMSGGLPCTAQQRAGLENHQVAIARLATIPTLIGAVGLATGIVLVLVNHKTTTVPTIEVLPTAGGASTTVGWTF